MSKKTRGPNFSSNEKEILIELITKFKDLVENKKTDAVTSANKNEGWRKLTEEFNSLSSFSVRNTEQLKTCWDNIKRTTRKDKARTKKELFLTGGGRPNLPPTEPFLGQVEVLLGPTLSGLENPFDSDAQYSEQVLSENEIEVPQNELIVIPSIPLESDECSKVVQEIECTGPLEISEQREDECSNAVPECKDVKMWNGWSPAALKSKVSDPLVLKKKKSPSWLQRRRPKASIQDKLLQSKLELVEIMKKNNELDLKHKLLLHEEQLKQEKIRTAILELQLKKEQNS
ncbi:uncharacterized protein LOC135077687 [Ostrinia nubilalis]|uniref:uncharacterized protein LOC135077687 n=1 Tax=Ostrinia nubilalis TaxID=29057 RepID=UPI0030825D7B